MLFKVTHDVGLIQLNRPKALNALHVGMMSAIRQQLNIWRDDPMIKGVIVFSEDPKSFCAGGDLRQVYNAMRHRDFPFLETLFRHEYALNHLIQSFPKPYIAILNGIAMGGGLGLSAHGRFRILSEDVMAAMPETNIGYFPDVGATYFLNQAPGAIGLYLGLTGNAIATDDALWAGIGTHIVPRQHHAQLMHDLTLLTPFTSESLEAVIGRYAIQPAPCLLQTHAWEIDAYFSAPSYAELEDRLHHAGTPFAQRTLEILAQRSPTSRLVTFQQLQQGATMTMAEVMRLEFVLSQNFIKSHDFPEGIRAAIIDKDKKPQWEPSDWQAIAPETIEAYFHSDLPELGLDG